MRNSVPLGLVVDIIEDVQSAVTSFFLWGGGHRLTEKIGKIDEVFCEGVLLSVSHNKKEMTLVIRDDDENGHVISFAHQLYFKQLYGCLNERVRMVRRNEKISLPCLYRLDVTQVRISVLSGSDMEMEFVGREMREQFSFIGKNSNAMSWGKGDAAERFSLEYLRKQ